MSADVNLDLLGARAGAAAITAGRLTALQWVDACLARIAEREPAVQAWQHLDAAHARAQASERDAERDIARATGRPLGPLHGVPVGLKDIIDTADLPTENGSPLHAGRRPKRDATVVARLRAAGAVILGKTVSTEFATYTAGKTRNPHDPARTPGGSSSGSAAAVAAGMVPLALGTQSNASIIRPAAFCGVHGFKPSHGQVSRHGVLKLSRTLDAVGVFARNLDDIALVAEQIGGFDAADPDTRPQLPLRLGALPHGEPVVTPRLAFVKTPMWERCDASTQRAFETLHAALGAQCVEVKLPDWMGVAWDWHRTVMEAEMAANLEREWLHGQDALSPSLREQLRRGREVSALAYQQALAGVPRLLDGLAGVFGEFDAIVTPATRGTAPPIETTGDPAFGTLWTLCGLPAFSLPLLQGDDGLPLGVQLVGACGDDVRLLRTARWLETGLA